MSYLDRIATEDPADLIAAEVPAFEWRMKTEFGQLAAKHITYAQARKNRALVERAMEELREIWRLARRGDEAWRERLAAINAEYRGKNRVASVRWELVIKHAPVAAEQACAGAQG